MKLLALSIQGFRSFTTDQVIRFDGDASGFFLLSGENLAEPSLGENGAGKSSVWEALVWVLFGKTSRGLRAKAISNWSESELTNVFVQFEIGGVSYEVVRTWSPNTLTVREVKEKEARQIEQAELETLIGISYEGFLHSTVLGQFGEYFPDLPPAERMRVLSAALHLDEWQERSKRAAEEQKVHEAELAELTPKKANIVTAIKENKRLLADFRRHAATWGRERADLLKGARVELKEAKRAQAVIAEEAEQASKAWKAAQTRLEAAQERLVRADAELTGPARERLWAAKEALRAAQRTADDAARSVDEAGALGAECEVCESTLPAAHLATVLARRAKALKKARKTVDAATEAQAVAQGELDALQQLRAEAEAAYLQAEGAHKRSRAEVTALVREVAIVDRNLDLARDRLRTAKEAEDPYMTQARRLTVRIAKRRKRVRIINQKIAEAQERLECVMPWVEHFKELRLWLISGAVLEVEVAANNALGTLGLHGWRIKCLLERALETGGAKRGLHVEIAAPHSRGFVPWEGWSGGETQRLRIALAAAMSDVICARSGYRPSLEAWDEPTAHLSAAGIEDMLEFFALRARQRGRQVWLIDHRSLNSGAFTAEWRVVKETSGSRIVFHNAWTLTAVRPLFVGRAGAKDAKPARRSNARARGAAIPEAVRRDKSKSRRKAALRALALKDSE